MNDPPTNEELYDYHIHRALTRLQDLGFSWWFLPSLHDCRAELYCWHPDFHEMPEDLKGIHWSMAYRSMLNRGIGFALYWDGGPCSEASRQTLLQNKRILEENSDLIETCKVLSICS